MDNNCRLCSIVDGGYAMGKADTPILQTENFLMIPDAGALVKGWVLIVPTVHCCSMRDFYSKSIFTKMFDKAINRLTDVFECSRILFFEHGANKFDSLTSCGTNHAHLHMMPGDFSILDSISSKYRFDRIELDKIGEYIGTSEYLMYGEYDVNTHDLFTYITLLSEPTSQFFRKEIAEKLGCLDNYNYKDHLNLNIAENTFTLLAGES